MITYLRITLLTDNLFQDKTLHTMNDSCDRWNDSYFGQLSQDKPLLYNLLNQKVIV